MLIYVHSIDGDLHEVEIQGNQTFWEFRKKACDLMGQNPNDVIFTADKEYNYDYNSKKINEIQGIEDNMTFYAVYQVGGGTKGIRY